MSDEPEKLAIGDYVIAAWKTTWDTRWVRGVIDRLAGNTVWIVYYYEHSDGGLVTYGIRTAKRTRGEVRLATPMPGELRPHAAVDARRAVAVERAKKRAEEQAP